MIKDCFEERKCLYILAASLGKYESKKTSAILIEMGRQKKGVFCKFHITITHPLRRFFHLSFTNIICSYRWQSMSSHVNLPTQNLTQNEINATSIPSVALARSYL